MDYIRYVILLSRVAEVTEDLIKAHVNHLKDLEAKGNLVLCGPFLDYPGGIIIIKAESLTAAKAIAERDPFVSAGVQTYELRTMEVSSRDNNHLGMG